MGATERVPVSCTVLGLAAACHPGPAVLVTAITTTLAASGGRSAAGCLAVAAAALAGQLSVGWCNDSTDALRDLASNRSDKPIVRGLVTRSTVAVAALAAVIATVPLSLLSGWRATLAHLSAVALAWAYDLGLKSTLWSVATYAGAFGLLPIFVTLGLTNHPLPTWWAITGAAVLGAGAHLANALPDLADDEATGVRGLPQVLGLSGSCYAAGTLLAIASALLVVGPRQESPEAIVREVLAAVLATSLVVVVLLSRRHPSWAFTSAMALAGVDVILLVTTGPMTH